MGARDDDDDAWRNGYCESFNSRFRDELLNGEVFSTLCEAKIVDRAMAPPLQHRQTAQLPQIPSTRA